MTDRQQYQVCSRCVLDTTDVDITFDFDGICNHCHHWAPRIARLPKDAAEESENLRKLGDRFEEARRKKGGGYDCVVGVSGGVDSSYIVLLAHRMKWNPLLVHFDNGWNSELSVANVAKLIDKTNFDYVTHVVDWDEFRDLQLAYLRASVVDIECATDHAIIATMYKTASRFEIPFILSGGNIATESGMPKQWTWPKKDLTNLKGIHKAYGSRRLRSYPMRSYIKDIVEKRLFKRVTDIRVLDQIVYSKRRAIADLIEHVGWTPYVGKHEESLFTKLYQDYILPKKFNIDKRRVHLSSLIRNGEITRDAAIQQLASPPAAAEDVAAELEFVIRKLGISTGEFEAIMRKPPVSHEVFGSDYKKVAFVKRVLQPLIGP